MQIGILALQGAFIEHYKMLKQLGVDSFEIRQKKDLSKPMDGLIFPGGESTTMYKLLKDLDLFDTIKQMILDGMPIFGTCAGLLLLAKNVKNHSTSYMQVMDITAVKNAYGRQLGSFRTVGVFNDVINVPFVFIRAPYIESIGDDVQVLAVVDGKIVAAREKNMLATAFHPELTDNLTIHEYFVSMCKEYKKS